MYISRRVCSSTSDVIFVRRFSESFATKCLGVAAIPCDWQPWTNVRAASKYKIRYWSLTIDKSSGQSSYDIRVFGICFIVSSPYARSDKQYRNADMAENGTSSPKGERMIFMVGAKSTFADLVIVSLAISSPS